MKYLIVLLLLCSCHKEQPEHYNKYNACFSEQDMAAARSCMLQGVAIDSRDCMHWDLTGDSIVDVLDIVFMKKYKCQ